MTSSETPARNAVAGHQIGLELEFITKLRKNRPSTMIVAMPKVISANQEAMETTGTSLAC